MSYFSGFLAFLFLFVGFFSLVVFLGRPGPETPLIRSTTDSSYIFVFPAWSLGWIPASYRRILAALGEIPSFSAISLIVKPFILILSASLTNLLKKLNIVSFFLTNINRHDIVSIIGWLPVG